MSKIKRILCLVLLEAGAVTAIWFALAARRPAEAVSVADNAPAVQALIDAAEATGAGTGERPVVQPPAPDNQQEPARQAARPRKDSAADPGDVRFVTLASPDDFFAVRGTLTGVARYSGVEAAPLDLGESDQYRTKVRFRKPGFYGLTVRETDEQERYYSVFVSPLPTKHADAAGTDFNWYRTQFNTGTTSNCGPASASMAIAWSTGKQFPVSLVRQAVGWQGEGGTSFEELITVIRDQGIPALISPIRNAQSVKDVIDSGGVAVVLFRTDGVRTAEGNPGADLFGKYYDDTVGHYIVIKGYSLDGEYFVIYDPIPSNWSSNGFRYGDEVSMIGQNRYYPAEELLRSLRRSDMIVAPLSR